jgi:hypothetical protein
MKPLEEKVDNLETYIAQLAYEQMKTEIVVRDFKKEMLEFKDEMKEFKDEMKEFKDEMKDFKNEMKDFKDEMLEFKVEMKGFKKESNKMWSDLANKMGTIVEDIVAPNLPRIAQEYFGCNAKMRSMIRVKQFNTIDNSKKREFDIIIVTEDKLIINETKSTSRIHYIDDFIDVLKEIFDYFPEYKDKKLIPVFSSLQIPDEVVKYLTKNNIYALGMKDDTMTILNAGELEL